MSDREKCIPSPPLPPSPHPENRDWERHPTFRHTFLVHFPPDVAHSVQELGLALYHLVLARPLEPSGPPPESWTAARLRATAADLRFHADHLGEIARERHASSLEPADALLSERAEAWAHQAQALARRIEAALP